MHGQEGDHINAIKSGRGRLYSAKAVKCFSITNLPVIEDRLKMQVLFCF